MEMVPTERADVTSGIWTESNEGTARKDPACESERAADSGEAAPSWQRESGSPVAIGTVNRRP